MTWLRHLLDDLGMDLDARHGFLDRRGAQVLQADGGGADEARCAPSIFSGGTVPFSTSRADT